MIELKIDRALSIEGWMSREELTWLAGQASKRSRIVEVGSWRGRSTAALSDNTLGEVWAVDTWRGSPEHYGEMLQHGRCWLYNEFMRNKAPNVTEVCMSSLSAASLLSPERFDMIFIDGRHDYEAVKADILAWRPLLSRFGLLCGHDWSGDFPGVRQAVRELCPRHHRPVGSIWVEDLL